jgi:hypothetical protein
VSVRIQSKGLREFTRFVERAPEAATEAARIAINDTLDLARRRGVREIPDQISFRKEYAKENLQVGRKASNTRLEGWIVGRDRPTSLAHFASGSPSFGRRTKAVRVKVSPRGGTREIRDAFFLRLRRGKELGDDSFNVGLAIRLKPGERISNKREMVQFANNVYLLYGPSIAQVFDDVAIDMEPELSDNLENEFIRQFQRLR